MLEVQVKRGGTWVSDSLFEDARLASFVAHQLEKRLGDTDTRVIKEPTGALRGAGQIGAPRNPRLRRVGIGGLAAAVAVAVAAVLAT